MPSLAVTLPLRLRSSFAGAVGGLPRTFWALWAGMLVNRLGGFVLPFLSLYLTQHRKLGVEEAGWILALYGLGSVGAVQLGGVLADRVGRRATMVAGLFSSAVAMALLGVAHAPLQIALATLALGFTNDLFRPALHAAVADVVPPADRLRAYGLVYWAINLAFSIASVLAGVLASRSYLLLFLGDAATTAACAVMVLLAVPETLTVPAPATEPSPAPTAGHLTPFLDRAFAPFLVLSVGLSILFHQFASTLPIEMRTRGLSEADYGRVLAVNGVLIVLAQPLLMPWLRRQRRGVALAAGTLLTGFGFGLNALVGTSTGYAAAVAVWTLGEILVSPLNASVVADLAPPQMRGRYQGAFGVTFSLSILTAPVVGTWVLARWGGGWLWGGCAVLGVALAIGHLHAAAGRRARMTELFGAHPPHRD